LLVAAVLIERLLDVGEDQLETLSGPAPEPLAHRFLEPRYFSLQRRAKQLILGREAVDKTALADSGTLGDGIEREIAAPGREDHVLGGIQDPIRINFLPSGHTSLLPFRLTGRITFPTDQSD
jgi:hypothetical protein